MNFSELEHEEIEPMVLKKYDTETGPDDPEEEELDELDRSVEKEDDDDFEEDWHNPSFEEEFDLDEDAELDLDDFGDDEDNS